MNLLLTSVGRRVALMQYFKKELNACGSIVIAADCDPMASALYFADRKEIVPKITSPHYIDELLRICAKHAIQGVVSLIDPELSILAPHKERFMEHGVRLILSDSETIDLCYDKKRTYNYITQHGIPGIPTFQGAGEVHAALQTGELAFPIFVKPRTGSGSVNHQILLTESDLEARIISGSDDIFQPLIQGEEYCTDVFVDMLSKKPVSIFGKKKVLMRAGEADKSISVNDPELLRFVERILSVIPLEGPVDMDFFKTEKGYVLSEINPRFGGGYPHAYGAGQNYIRYLLNNLNGQPNDSEVGRYDGGVMMMKYDQVLIL